MEVHDVGRRLLTELKDHILKVMRADSACGPRGPGLRNVSIERRAGLALRLGRQDHWITWSLLKALEREDKIQAVGKPTRWRLRARLQALPGARASTGVHGGAIYSSQGLKLGAIYTRRELAKQWNIRDATINNGVFSPKFHSSVWLFVTENKSSDRTPYKDRLQENVLEWQGQMSGRSDTLIISHSEVGKELLLFYRNDKFQYPGAGFRYEGAFRYQAHYPTKPTTFLLRRADAL